MICLNMVLTTMINVLVTGSNGQLGSEIRELVQKETYKTKKMQFYFTDVNELDITNFITVKEFVKTNAIAAIVNCAAYTAVDKAENDLDTANLVNNVAVRNFAAVAKENDIKLIHISTDYVFDGKNHKPYTEKDITSPNGVYGKTKLDGENALIEINPLNSIIIRTSWVYSFYGANFVKTMLRLGKEKKELGVIFDQIGTPTYAKDLASVILEILPQVSNKQTEIYNFSNEGVLSWYDFSKEIMDIANLECKVNPIETIDYPTPATRPCFSVLNKRKIKQDFNLQIPYWKESLQDCLYRLGKNNV